ncbi:non-heme iron oxygenase ferredoxin subunit [Pseudomonas qingdaonensis]|nr:non-heme iron oxygenase ferredoxin subunit [Pseudomonas qingdaonensis]
MSRVLLCQRDELAPGELKKVANGDGDALCVYNLGGTFYATTDMCTHATASLAEGDMEDDLITCPVHWGQFHIPSGKAVTFPANGTCAPTRSLSPTARCMPTRPWKPTRRWPTPTARSDRAPSNRIPVSLNHG